MRQRAGQVDEAQTDHRKGRRRVSAHDLDLPAQQIIEILAAQQVESTEVLHRTITELLAAAKPPGLAQAEIPDLADSQFVRRMGQAAVQTARLHFGIDKERLA